MFCTKCGIELREQDKFCNDCGTSTGRGPASSRYPERLTRPMQDAKVAGVCAGFARYFGVDVTLMRVIWLVLTIWPLPLLGVISYIIAWIVMPKEPAAVAARQIQATNG
jgi:phage shock protein C